MRKLSLKYFVLTKSFYIYDDNKYDSSDYKKFWAACYIEPYKRLFFKQMKSKKLLKKTREKNKE